MTYMYSDGFLELESRLSRGFACFNGERFDQSELFGWFEVGSLTWKPNWLNRDPHEQAQLCGALDEDKQISPLKLWRGWLQGHFASWLTISERKSVSNWFNLSCTCCIVIVEHLLQYCARLFQWRGIFNGIKNNFFLLRITIRKAIKISTGNRPIVFRAKTIFKILSGKWC